MTSYRLPISPKEQKVGRFLGRVRRELQKAFAEEKRSRKLSQAQIARELGVDRAVINRQLMGTENITLRRVGELAWALGRDPHFSLDKPVARAGSNEQPAETLKPNVTNLITDPIPGPVMSGPSGGNVSVVETMVGAV